MLVQVLVHEGDELIEVQWAQELTSEINAALISIYEGIEGIDEVDFRRYRHFLDVAPHIKGEVEVAEELQRDLLDDEELAWALQNADLGELEVQVAPKVSDILP